MGFALSILVWSRARVGFFSLGLGYVALLFGGVASLFLFGIFSSFLLFSRPWGSRSARPWGWLDGVSFLFLFLYATFPGWTYRTLYISYLMGLYIAAR